MSRPLHPDKAEAALAALKIQFAAWVNGLANADHPTLYPAGYHATGVTIAWESGPYDWPHLAFQGGMDEEVYLLAREHVSESRARAAATVAPVSLPAGVFAEPVNNWCLALYPDD